MVVPTLELSKDNRPFQSMRLSHYTSLTLYSSLYDYVNGQVLTLLSRQGALCRHVLFIHYDCSDCRGECKRERIREQLLMHYVIELPGWVWLKLTSRAGMALITVTLHPHTHTHAAKKKKLNMILGVTIPCCLSIFSVILFLRLGFVLGQVRSPCSTVI